LSGWCVQRAWSESPLLIQRSTPQRISKYNMSDSDDDLLELAGIGSGEESDYEPQVSTGRRTATKRKIDEEDEDDDGQDDDDDDEIEELDFKTDPYPLEGKYKDEADKQALMGMDEVSREGILYDRLQEKEKLRERSFLALRARQSKAESKTIEKSESSAKKLKTSKLSELKRQRERKQNEEARKSRGYEEEDDYGDEEDDDDDEDLRQLAGYDEEEDDDDGYYSDEAYGASKRSTSSAYGKSSRNRAEYDQSQYKEATLDILNTKIRSSRDVLQKFLYRQEFDTCIPGTMVRVNIGPSKATRQPQYRMALVEEVKRGGKPYSLGNKPCNTYLKVSQGDSSTIVDISCLSNSPFTPEDFEMYKRRLGQSSNSSLPLVRDVESKFTELKNMATRRLTDADINKMLARKEELAVNEMNTADRVRKLGRLREELQVALEQGNSSMAKSLQTQIDNLSQFFQGHVNTSKLEQINIRNQKSNQEFIRKAEKKLVETKRKQLQSNDFSDPFSRLRTNPKVFYKSIDKEDNEDKKEEEKVDEAEERRKMKNSIFRREGIDALIKTIDIDLDIDLNF
jgi:RNA polymerase-associated protein RTF1